MKKLLLFLIIAWVGTSAQCGLKYSNDTAICWQATVRLMATGANHYAWGFNSVTNYSGLLSPTDTSYYEIACGQSYSYVILTADSGACTTTKTITIVELYCDVGIFEYQQDEIKPVYFDVYGRKAEFKPGEFIIEQKGNKRCKVLCNIEN